MKAWQITVVVVVLVWVVLPVVASRWMQEPPTSGILR